MPQQNPNPIGQIVGGIGEGLKALFGIKKPPPRPKLPDLSEEAEPVRQEAVEAVRQAEAGEYQQQRDIQAAAERIGERVETQVGEAGAEIEDIKADLDARQEELDRSVHAAQVGLDLLPQNVRHAFVDSRYYMERVLNQSRSEVEGAREAALADVYTGQAQAMQAAVQETQGNVNAQIAEINANPNLTQAQKQQMTAQVRMQGSMQLGATVGATQLQFNTLAAYTSTAFGQILGNVETAGIAQRGALAVGGAQAEAQAFGMASQLGAELTNIQATADQAYAAAQSQLTGLRAQIEMTGNQFAMELAPAQATPFINHTDSALFDLQSFVDLLKSDAIISLQEYGIDVSAYAAEAAQGGLLEKAGGLIGAIRG